MEGVLDSTVNNLSLISSSSLTLVEFAVFVSVLLLSFRYFGKLGIHIFAVLAFIIANIQVLRQAQFFFQSSPVVLGTVSFCMVFLSTDMLVEHYGISAARRNILLTFGGHLFLISMMIITLSYNPKSDYYYNHLKEIFSLSPKLITASILSYVTSQSLDIYIFSYVREKLHGIKWLWLRSNISTLSASFVDNAVFSLLAWKILSSTPATLYELFFTYMLGPYWLIVFVSLWNTPVMYLSYLVKRES